MRRRHFSPLFRRLGAALAAAAVLGQVLAFGLHRPALAASGPAYLLLDPAAWCGAMPTPTAPQPRDAEHCTLCPVFTGPALPPPQALAIGSDFVVVSIPVLQAGTSVSILLSPLQARAPPSAV